MTLPWRLTHPDRPLAAAGRYPPVGHGASQPPRLRLVSPSKGQAPSGAPCSALHRPVIPITTTSADFCRPLPAPCSAGSTPLPGQARRSPRVRRATFAPSTCRIYADTLRMTLGFRSFGPLARVSSPLCASCSSGRSFAYSFLRTPPRDGALAVRLAVPVIKVRRGLSPPSRQPATTAGLDSASNGATRHAWRTNQKPRRGTPGFFKAGRPSSGVDHPIANSTGNRSSTFICHGRRIFPPRIEFRRSTSLLIYRINLHSAN